MKWSPFLRLSCKTCQMETHLSYVMYLFLSRPFQPPPHPLPYVSALQYDTKPKSLFLRQWRQRHYNEPVHIFISLSNGRLTEWGEMKCIRVCRLTTPSPTRAHHHQPESRASRHLYVAQPPLPPFPPTSMRNSIKKTWFCFLCEGMERIYLRCIVDGSLTVLIMGSDHAFVSFIWSFYSPDYIWMEEMNSGLPSCLYLETSWMLVGKIHDVDVPV